MIINILDYVACECLYLKEILNSVKTEFSDDYNVVVGSVNGHNEDHLRYCKKTFGGLIPGKKNILVLVMEETEELCFYEYLKDFDLIFRTYNCNLKLSSPKVFPIPCGYVTRLDFPYHKSELKKFAIRPLNERKYDIFFSGQKTGEREICVEEAKKINANSLLQLTEGFVRGFELNEYFDHMNNAKIALVPRGGCIAENFRYFDAYHANCIVITTMPLNATLSNIWYYHGSPAIRLDNWSQLNQRLIDSLLCDLDRYQLLNNEYYKKCVSVDGIAKYMIEILKNMFGS